VAKNPYRHINKIKLHRPTNSKLTKKTLEFDV
jgi:hypothetical protein